MLAMYVYVCMSIYVSSIGYKSNNAGHPTPIIFFQGEKQTVFFSPWVIWYKEQEADTDTAYKLAMKFNN